MLPDIRMENRNDFYTEIESTSRYGSPSQSTPSMPNDIVLVTSSPARQRFCISPVSTSQNYMRNNYT